MIRRYYSGNDSAHIHRIVIHSLAQIIKRSKELVLVKFYRLTYMYQLIFGLLMPLFRDMHFLILLFSRAQSYKLNFNILMRCKARKPYKVFCKG